jgi:outer membrane murein-binding lipoprotein Lpp
MRNRSISKLNISSGLLIAAALLTGCASNTTTQAPTPDPDVSASMRSLIEHSDAQRAKAQAAAQPAVMSGSAISVVWEGDGKEILSRLAQAQGLKFRVSGPRPQLPLPVFIHLKGVSLNDALMSIGDQMGGRADVILSDDGIELHTKLY